MSRQDKDREADVASFLRDRAEEEQVGREVRRNRAVSTMMARERLFLKELEEMLGKVFEKKIVPSRYALEEHRQVKSRILNLVLSDIHLGANLDPREVPHAYGPEEEARSLAAVCKQTAEYKPQYRKDTILYVHLLGDIIQGQLHDLRDGKPMAEQVAVAMSLLIQAISFLSAHFPKVVVWTTPGNHGRNKHRHPERAVNEKWDSNETAIYYALKLALNHVPNVEVHIIRKPFYTWDAFDQRGFATHGDTVLSPGYPGKTIDVAGVRKQINEFNASQPANKQCKLFVVGHVHVGSVVSLPNGTTFMSNGCLIPPDAYATSIGIFEGNCGQSLFESVKGHIVGDYRFVIVDEDTRQDKSLEKIIKPFDGF